MEEFVACTLRAQEEITRPQTCEELAKTAHRLRGSFSYLVENVEGGVVERIRTLEQACLGRNDTLVPALIRSVTEGLEALLGQLQKEIHEKKLTPRRPPFSDASPSGFGNGVGDVPGLGPPPETLSPLPRTSGRAGVPASFFPRRRKMPDRESRREISFFCSFL